MNPFRQAHQGRRTGTAGEQTRPGEGGEDLSGDSPLSMVNAVSQHEEYECDHKCTSWNLKIFDCLFDFGPYLAMIRDYS